MWWGTLTQQAACLAEWQSTAVLGESHEPWRETSLENTERGYLKIEAYENTALPQGQPW